MPIEAYIEANSVLRLRIPKSNGNYMETLENMPTTDQSQFCSNSALDNDIDRSTMRCDNDYFKQIYFDQLDCSANMGACEARIDGITWNGNGLTMISA